MKRRVNNFKYYFIIIITVIRVKYVCVFKPAKQKFNKRKVDPLERD